MASATDVQIDLMSDEELQSILDELARDAGDLDALLAQIVLEAGDLDELLAELALAVERCNL